MTYVLYTSDTSEEKIPVHTVFCLGRNYAEHAREMGAEVPEEPVIFIKPATSLQQGAEPIALPDFSDEIHYEVELVLLLDAVPKRCSPEEGERRVLGIGVGLDLTARDIQKTAKEKGLPWTLSKGFDNSAPVSAFVPVQNGKLDPSIRLSLRVNDVTVQDEKLAAMLLKPGHIVSYLSRYFTLRRGDLVFTGTPKGVGRLNRGDSLIAALEDIVSFNTKVM